MRHLPAVLTYFLWASLSSACGSSGGNAPPDSGAPSGAAGSPGGTPGSVVVACSTPAKFSCGAQTFIGMPAAQIALERCSNEGGMPLTKCPTEGLIGCCTQSIIKLCYYMGVASTPAKLEMVCMEGRGTWATSP